MTADIATEKQALRRSVKAGRRARSAAENARNAARIAAVALEMPKLRRADCVTAYASLPDEPGTGPLRSGLRALGVRVLLPVVAPGETRTLDWGVDDASPLSSSGLLDLPEPTGPHLGAGAVDDAQVLIVPALAVDTSGTRLGRGRGYYDTAMRLAQDALFLALVHDDEVIDAGGSPIPREAHDIPVHGVITPTRWMFF